MAFKTLLAVAGSEIRLLTRSGAMWKLTGIHCALLVAALLLTWPTPERVASATPPFTLKWLLLTELIALAYISLALTSDSFTWGEAERLRPPHWVAYGTSPAWAALTGRILALWYVIAFLALTALPLAVLAHGASPVPIRVLAAWTGAALSIMTLLGIAGLLIGCHITERSARMIAVDVACLAVAIALIAVGGRGDHPSDGLLFYLNPVKVLTYILDPPLRSVDGTLFPELSWVKWWALQAALHLIAFALTTVQLKRWIRRQPPHRADGRALSHRSKGAS